MFWFVLMKWDELENLNKFDCEWSLVSFDLEKTSEETTPGKWLEATAQSGFPRSSYSRSVYGHKLGLRLLFVLLRFCSIENNEIFFRRSSVSAKHSFNQLSCGNTLFSKTICHTLNKLQIHKILYLKKLFIVPHVHLEINF